MDLIEGKISNLKAFRDSLKDIMEAVIREGEESILSMNTTRLYVKGERTDGSRITPAYTPFTTQIKMGKGQPTDRVTLRDTGDFYRAFYIEYHTDGFEVYSRDYKADALTAKYGEGIFGLTEGDKKYVAEDILLPGLLNEIHKV